MNKDKLLSGFITDQYDLKKLEEIIKAFLDLIETANLILDDEYYNFKMTANYEIQLTGHSNVRNISSKIESFVIHKYDTMEKLQELILKYQKAYNSMNTNERKLFKRLYVDREKKAFIQDEMLLHQYQYDAIKKSMIVKFCLVLGLDKYTELF